jgi:hypothetical protein
MISFFDQVSVDATGAPTGGPHYITATMFSEGLAAAKDTRSNWGSIDAQEHHVVQPQFDGANPFSDGCAAVKKGGKWGFIDATGKK